MKQTNISPERKCYISRMFVCMIQIEIKPSTHHISYGQKQRTPVDRPSTTPLCRSRSAHQCPPRQYVPVPIALVRRPWRSLHCSTDKTRYSCILPCSHSDPHGDREGGCIQRHSCFHRTSQCLLLGKRLPPHTWLQQYSHVTSKTHGETVVIIRRDEWIRCIVFATRNDEGE